MKSICNATMLAGVLMISTTTYTQVKLDGYEVGINAGTLVYQGDLSSGVYGNLKSLRPAVGIYVAKAINSYFKLRGTVVRGRIMANEADYSSPEWRQQRNFSFTTPVTELSVTAVFQPYGNEQDFKRLTPYVFAGAGISILNVKRDWSRINTTVFDDKTAAMIGLGRDTLHKPSHVLPVIPIGVGLHYSITNKIGLTAEGVYRYTTSDYVDGFKYAGNPDRKDSYYGVSIGLSFLLGKDKYACPTVSKY
ncbi:MAG TPA: DUF6089 family protein [Segetibacter sp.]|jgi:hypothetical protein